MWIHEATGQFTWADVKHYSGVGDGLIPVIYGHFLVYEIKATSLQDNSLCGFFESVLDLASHWGCHNLGAVCQEPYVVHSSDHSFVKFCVEL